VTNKTGEIDGIEERGKERGERGMEGKQERH